MGVHQEAGHWGITQRDQDRWSDEETNWQELDMFAGTQTAESEAM
jgi:hypothetical protein